MDLKYPDSHGWFSLGLFCLTILVFGLMAWNPDHLRDNDLFKMLAQGVILTGLINLAASFYFGASKGPSTPPADPQP